MLFVSVRRFTLPGWLQWSSSIAADVPELNLVAPPSDEPSIKGEWKRRLHPNLLKAHVINVWPEFSESGSPIEQQRRLDRLRCVVAESSTPEAQLFPVCFFPSDISGELIFENNSQYMSNMATCRFSKFSTSPAILKEDEQLKNSAFGTATAFRWVLIPTYSLHLDGGLSIVEDPGNYLKVLYFKLNFKTNLKSGFTLIPYALKNQNHCFVSRVVAGQDRLYKLLREHSDIRSYFLSKAQKFAPRHPLFSTSPISREVT